MHVDLESRYGPMVSLDELASYFGAHVRAVRNVLELHRVPLFTMGRSTIVPLRAVERALELESLMIDEDFLRHERARRRSSYHDDGAPKSVEEYVAEVEAHIPPWLELIEAAREGRARLPA